MYKQQILQPVNIVKLIVNYDKIIIKNLLNFYIFVIRNSRGITGKIRG